MFKYTKEELIELKSDKSYCNPIEKLTDELLENLISYYNKNVNVFNADVNYLFVPPLISLCGCMGPQNGDLLCACSMKNSLWAYRYDVALAVLEQQEKLK
jgi:hypothetical protein